MCTAFNTDPTTGGLINTGTPGYASSLPMLLFNSFAVGNNWLNLYQPNTTYGIGDTFSKTIGNHSLSFGGDYRYYQLNARNECGPNGYFQFTGNETDRMSLTTTSALQLLLCNAPFSCWITLLVMARSSSQIPGRSTHNLTLNLGLRWDVARPWSWTIWGRLTTPVPGAQKPKFPDSPAGNLVPGYFGIPIRFLPRSTTISDCVFRRSRLLPAGSRVKQRPAFAPLTVSIIWVRRTKVPSASSAMLHRASTGHRRSPRSLPVHTSLALPGVSQGQHFPFTFPSGTGPFPELPNSDR